MKTYRELEKIIAGMRGQQFVYDNEDDIYVIATVVAADIAKGITVKGVVPTNVCRSYGAKPEEEVVLCCLQCEGVPLHEIEDDIKKFEVAIETGFLVHRNTQDPLAVLFGKSASEMEMSCPFS